MPKVTLLKDEWSDYVVMVGMNEVQFFGGKPKTVNPHVAIACRKVNVRYEEPIFAVDDMPPLVNASVEEQNAAGVPIQEVMVDQKWL